jgi:hypothetical protein
VISAESLLNIEMTLACGCRIRRRLGSEEFRFMPCSNHAEIKVRPGMTVAELEREIIFSRFSIPSLEPEMGAFYCQKCKRNFGSKKDLKAHKVDKHSY